MTIFTCTKNGRIEIYEVDFLEDTQTTIKSSSILPSIDQAEQATPVKLIPTKAF
jgi:hypothetical protein